MLQSYRIAEANEASLELAQKITALIVDSAVSYQEAEDALEAAQKRLMETTRPVCITEPASSGSEHGSGLDELAESMAVRLSETAEAACRTLQGGEQNGAN